MQWASGYGRVNYDPYQIPTVTFDSHFAHVTGGGGGLTSPSIHADYLTYTDITQCACSVDHHAYHASRKIQLYIQQ